MHPGRADHRAGRVCVPGMHPGAQRGVYGQGSQLDRLRDLADALAPGRVRFPGLVSGEEVARALSRSAAGLASLRPGMGYDFSYPTKMFAATACGTRVIYAGPGPGRSMVADHGLGWGVDWDVESVATAMAAALSHAPSSDQATRLTMWTREHASQDSVASVAADTLATHVRR